MDSKHKFFLFKQSENFCAAPWINLFLDTNGDIFTCCVGKTILGNIRKEKIQDILSGSILKNIKNNLIQNNPDSNCITCQKLNSDSNAWMRGHYNDIGKSINIDYENTDEFQLGSVDPRWSNTCNLKCIYCGPSLSSSIEKELNISISNGNYGNDSLLEFILDNQDNIKEIYLAGGEPLLMKENQIFLEKYTNFNTKLRINTNLTNINEKNHILELIKRFKNVTWVVSIENIQARYEFTRFGSNWNQFLINIDTIQKFGHTIRFNMIYFIGNAITFYDDYNLLKNLVPNCQFSVVPVIDVDTISVANLPLELKSKAHDMLNKMTKDLANDPSLCNNVSNCIKELEKESNGLDYYQYFDSFDTKRGTNWKTVFPELVYDIRRT